MVKELIDEVIESIREDCKNMDRLYGERSCDYCRNNKVCEAIYKLKFKE